MSGTSEECQGLGRSYLNAQLKVVSGEVMYA
jgi:hypothetical protein